MRAPDFEPVFDKPVSLDAADIAGAGRHDLVVCHDYGGCMLDCGPDAGKISWLGNPGTFSGEGKHINLSTGEPDPVGQRFRGSGNVAVGPVGDDATARIATVEPFHCDDRDNVVFLNRFGAAAHGEPAIRLGPPRG